MSGQPGHHREDGRIRVRPQAELFAQRPLVFPLALHVCSGIVHGDRLVGCRVKRRRVNAVGNAPQPRIAQHAVEPVRIVRIAQLVRVGLGNGRHNVRHLNGAFHHVDRAVKGKSAAVLLRKTKRVIKEGCIRPALILHIVDGEYRPGIRAPVVVERAVINDRHSGLPVVAVQDLRLEIQIIQRCKNGLGKIGKPLAVVKVAVDRTARAEIVVIVDEIDL